MRRGSRGDGEAPCWAAWRWPARSSPATSRTPSSRVVLVGLYGLYRAATERGLKARLTALGMAVVLVVVGVLVSAVQWVPSKELLDRSPRAGGLTWDELIFGSWHPELLPTLVVREAYGTRARDTDWMDGYYPYHEMNAYMGLIAMALAVVGAGGPAKRDRWANFWVVLVGIGARPDAGQVHVPVRPGQSRSRSWAARASRCGSTSGSRWGSRPWRPSASSGWGGPGAVSLRGGLILAGVLVVALDPDHDLYLYPGLDRAEALDHALSSRPYRWLGRELTLAAIRTAVLAGLAWWVARTRRAVDRPGAPRAVGRVAAAPGHRRPPGRALVRRRHDRPPLLDRAARDGPALKADPGFIRVFGIGRQASRRAGLCLGAGRFPLRPRPARLEPAAGLAPAHVEGEHADVFPPAVRLRRPDRHRAFGPVAATISRATRTSSPA